MWYLNSEHAALQLRMEDSWKGKRDGEKELPTPNPHVDGKKGERAIVYNTKEGKKKGEKKRENNKNCILSSDNIKAYPRRPFVLIQTYNFFLLTLESNILALDPD